MGYRVGIDSGGTFTDLQAIDDNGRVEIVKLPSTPDSPDRGFRHALEALLDRLDGDGGRIDAVLHGTTVAVNAILQRQFPPIGLLVTKGFRHILELGRQTVPGERGSIYVWVKPPRIVHLSKVREVSERLTAKGQVTTPFDDDDDHGEDDEDLDFGDDWFADLKDGRVRHSSGRGGSHDRDELEYKLKVKRIVGVTEAHIHLGLPDMNGPVVANLYGSKVFSDPIEGDLSRGVLTVADLDGGPFEGDWAGFLEAMGLGELYVNVHTAEFPSGEIRGQIGVRKAKEHDEFNRPPRGEITSPEGDVSIAPGESVFFEGTADDPDGDPITVLWDFGDGESSTDARLALDWLDHALTHSPQIRKDAQRVKKAGKIGRGESCRRQE